MLEGTAHIPEVEEGIDLLVRLALQLVEVAARSDRCELADRMRRTVGCLEVGSDHARQCEREQRLVFELRPV